MSSRSNGFYPIIAVLLTFIGWHLLTVNYTVAIWLAVPTLLWLLWSLIQGVFSKNPINILIRQVRVRLLIMSTCMAMIVFALASNGFVISERYWIRQDRLTNLPKDRLAASSYEAKVTESLYQKIIEIRDRR